MTLDAIRSLPASNLSMEGDVTWDLASAGVFDVDVIHAFANATDLTGDVVTGPDRHGEPLRIFFTVSQGTVIVTSVLR